MDLSFLNGLGSKHVKRASLFVPTDGKGGEDVMAGRDILPCSSLANFTCNLLSIAPGSHTHKTKSKELCHSTCPHLPPSVRS